MDARAYFEGKRITVMGLGLLGRSVGDAEYLASCGAHLTITDLKTREELTESIKRLSQFSNIEYVLGEHRLSDFEGKDLILKSAGVPLESTYIAHAKEHGVAVRMSADLFAEISNIPIVGITGTRGKSTVTQMIYDILVANGRKVLLGGNVRGVSTLALLPKVTPEHIAVLELDSWQCHGFGEAGISPHTAVFTTFMDDHLVYYKNDIDAYLSDKAQIFLNQSEKDILVIGSQAKAILFAKYQKQIKSKVIEPETLPASLTLRVPGVHNRYNAEIARATALSLDISEETIFKTLEQFKGVSGRLELVREVNSVSYYNDTNATTPDATLAGLKALGEEKNIVLIMGGHDKGLNMHGLLKELPHYTKRVILLSGSGTNRILGEVANPSVFDSLQGAFEEASRYATEGDVVLFSPAFASFGMFKNEYDRGDQFTTLVQQL
jgi:UDP-N-acetylmuramoylalanine--D-glutamate ligase